MRTKRGPLRLIVNFEQAESSIWVFARLECGHEIQVRFRQNLDVGVSKARCEICHREAKARER